MVEELDLESSVFGAALNLEAPWFVAVVEFDPEVQDLGLSLSYPRGSRFGCPMSGCEESACPVHDTLSRSWRHLDFFQHLATLHARVPRVRCPEHGVRLIDVSWARAGCGFTKLFEAAVLTLSKHMAVAPVAEMAGENDTRLWRIVEHYVEATRADEDFADVADVGMDETSSRRGQDYVSIFMDLVARRVLFAVEGRDAATVEAFAADLADHGGQPANQIKRATCDMSPAFIKGINEHLGSPPVGDDPGHQPDIVFDRYHVVAKMNKAVDQVRKEEYKTRPELKRSRYAWLKNSSNLTEKQRELIVWLSRPSMALRTARAARWRDDFNGFYDQPTPEAAAAYLRRWCYGAKRSRLAPVKAFVKSVEAHWDGVMAWAEHRISNGLLEGTNSLIQSAKRRARGYRTKSKMITIIYLIAGKLPLPQIHTI